MNRQSLLIFSLLLLVSSFLFSFFEDNDEETAKTLQVPKLERHVKVSIVSPKIADMPMSQTVTGITEPHQKNYHKHTFRRYPARKKF